MYKMFILYNFHKNFFKYFQTLHKYIQLRTFNVTLERRGGGG